MRKLPPGTFVPGSSWDLETNAKRETGTIARAVTHLRICMLDWLWRFWRALMHLLLREPDDEREEGSIEGAFQISCLIIALVVGVAVLLAWLSK